MDEFKMSKFGSRKVYYDGYWFDSEKEMHRFQELELMVKNGNIKYLGIHPKFILQESFIYQGKKIQPITYSPDFQYIEDGVTVCEDAKGIDNRTGRPVTLTEASGIKIKMFKKLHPDIDFRIV